MPKRAKAREAADTPRHSIYGASRPHSPYNRNMHSGADRYLKLSTLTTLSRLKMSKMSRPLMTKVLMTLDIRTGQRSMVVSSGLHRRGQGTDREVSVKCTDCGEMKYLLKIWIVWSLLRVASV